MRLMAAGLRIAERGTRESGTLQVGQQVVGMAAQQVQRRGLIDGQVDVQTFACPCHVELEKTKVLGPHLQGDGAVDTGCRERDDVESHR